MFSYQKFFMMLTILMLFCVTSILAQDETEQSETFHTKLIYSVNRTPESIFETARSVAVITSEDIWRLNARNLPEVIMEQAGVFVQQTNYGGGAPIIRGFIGKDILIFVDGVKINTATYRYGPIQYLSTIDLNIVERIEIVRGIESVLSSYALGGIINIITKKGPPANNQKSVGSSLMTRYSSADKGTVDHAALYGKTENFRYYSGISYRKSSDVKGGNHIGIQEWTGYDELSGSINLDYFLLDDKILSLSYMVLEQNDVPRTDKFTSELKYNFDPQRLQLAKLSYQDFTSKGWLDFMRITLSWNRQDENLQRIVTSKPNVERRYNDDQTAVGLNVEFASFIGRYQRVLYGFDAFTEKIHSGRTDVDLTTNEQTSRRGTWTDGASYQTMALYLQDRINAIKYLTLTTGARLGYYSIDGQESSSVGDLDLASHGTDITGSVNVVFHPTSNINFVTNISRGFRSPNIDDVSVYDERTEGTEVPNPHVKSVKMYTYETGIKCEYNRFSASAFVYLSNVEDLMERSAGLLNGMPYYDKNNNGQKDEGEPDILQRQNIGEARIKGAEVEFVYTPSPQVSIFGNYIWTQGKDINKDVPLSRIPPDYGLLGLRWNSRTKLKPHIEFSCHFADSQKELNPSDISDVRIGPEGTEGFVIFNIRSGVSFSQHFRFVLNLENLFNKKYKYHASGVYRPGFNLVACAEIRL